MNKGESPAQSRLCIVRSVFLKTAVCYTLVSLGYTALLSLTLGGKSVKGDVVFPLLFKNFIVMFIASCIFGASFLIFRAKKLPPVGKRIIHILILYADTLAASLIMATPDNKNSQIVLFIFIATMLYALIYGICCAVAAGIKHFAKK